MCRVDITADLNDEDLRGGSTRLGRRRAGLRRGPAGAARRQTDIAGGEMAGAGGGR